MVSCLHNRGRAVYAALVPRKSKRQPLGNRNAMTIRVPLRVMFKLRAEARRRRKPPSTLASEILEQHFGVAGPCFAAHAAVKDGDVDVSTLRSCLRASGHEGPHDFGPPLSERVTSSVTVNPDLDGIARAVLEPSDEELERAVAQFENDETDEEREADAREFCRDY